MMMEHKYNVKNVVINVNYVLIILIIVKYVIIILDLILPYVIVLMDILKMNNKHVNVYNFIFI